MNILDIYKEIKRSYKEYIGSFKIRKTKKPFFQNETEKSDRENSKTKTSGFPTHAQKRNSV